MSEVNMDVDEKPVENPAEILLQALKESKAIVEKSIILNDKMVQLVQAVEERDGGGEANKSAASSPSHPINVLAASIAAAADKNLATLAQVQEKLRCMNKVGLSLDNRLVVSTLTNTIENMQQLQEESIASLDSIMAILDSGGSSDGSSVEDDFQKEGGDVQESLGQDQVLTAESDSTEFAPVSLS